MCEQDLHSYYALFPLNSIPFPETYTIGPCKIRFPQCWEFLQVFHSLNEDTIPIMESLAGLLPEAYRGKYKVG